MIKILLVDDSSFMRKLLKESLLELDKNAKLDILEAEEFDSAIDLFKKFSPDLCFFDVVIGEKSGLDLLEEVKKLSNTVRVVMLSSAGQKIIRDKAKSLGAETFLDKPFLKKDLINILKI